VDLMMWALMDIKKFFLLGENKEIIKINSFSSEFGFIKNKDII